MAASAAEIPTMLAIYVWTAVAIGFFLHWKWRTAENGLRAPYIAALCPVIAPSLAAYHLVALLYTIAVVLRARRAGRATRSQYFTG